jgi:hypothetical protein
VVTVPILPPELRQAGIVVEAKHGFPLPRVRALAMVETAADPVFAAARIQQEQRVRKLVGEQRKQLVGFERELAGDVLHVGEHVELLITLDQTVAVGQVAIDAACQIAAIPVHGVKAVELEEPVQSARATFVETDLEHLGRHWIVPGGPCP